MRHTHQLITLPYQRRASHPSFLAYVSQEQKHGCQCGSQVRPPPHPRHVDTVEPKGQFFGVS